MYWAKPRTVPITSRSMDELESWVEILRELASAREAGVLDPNEEFLARLKIPYSSEQVFTEFRRRGGM